MMAARRGSVAGGSGGSPSRASTAGGSGGSPSRASTAGGSGGSPSRASTVAALQTALAAEQAASYGYGVVGAHLTGTAFNIASADCVLHERARDALTRLITSLGATPRAAAAAYKLPIGVSSAADAARLAVDLEVEVVASYVDLAAVPDPRLRTLAARNMQNAYVRAARWGAKSRPFPGLAP